MSNINPLGINSKDYLVVANQISRSGNKQTQLALDTSTNKFYLIDDDGNVQEITSGGSDADLQVITDNGNTTTNQIVTGNITVTDNDESPLITGNYYGNVGAPLMTFNDLDNEYTQTINAPSGVDDDRDYTLPNASGTIALNETITLEMVTGNGNITNQQIESANIIVNDNSDSPILTGKFYGTSGAPILRFTDMENDNEYNLNGPTGPDGSLEYTLPNASGTIALDETITLQSVTDNDNTTSNRIESGNITITDVSFGESMLNLNYNSGDGTILMSYNDTNLENTTAVFANSSPDTNFTQLTLPSRTGTIALLSDLDNVPLYTKVVISNTELGSSGTTPVVLIAAPGAGKFIMVTNVSYYFDFALPAYVYSGVRHGLMFVANSGTIYEVPGGPLYGVSDFYGYSYYNSLGQASSFVNLPMLFTSADEVYDLGIGGGSLTFYIQYRICDI